MRNRRRIRESDLAPHILSQFDKPVLPAKKSRVSQFEIPELETDDRAKLLHAEVQRVKKKREKRDAGHTKEDLFDFQVRSYGLPTFVRQYPFAKEKLSRRWLLDFANHEFMVAVEIEGIVMVKINGEWVCKGRHATITGFKEDCLKYSAAVRLGWSLLRFEQSQVKDGTAIQETLLLLHEKGWRRE